MAGGLRSPGAVGLDGGERLRPAERLRRRADFLRCYREGRRRQGIALALYFIPNALGHARMGMTASRKVGKAVDRHRLKRRIREIYRRSEERRRLPALDVVVHLKPEAKGLKFETFRQELLRGLASLAAGRRDHGSQAPAESEVRTR